MPDITVSRSQPSRPEPVYIGSEIYRHSTYGSGHLLSIARVSTCTDLVLAMGWINEARFLTAPMASIAEIVRFHDLNYVAALQHAEATQAVDAADRARFAIGAEGNPVYPEVFRRAATSAGGVMLAARTALAGGIVHVPGGGTHHARRARAAGFCYLNDPVLGLRTWLDAGLHKVVYLDIDAHHCDGVQEAFAGDARVLMISVHEDGRWPRTGAAEDRAGGSARNLPVPRGLNDSEFLHLLEAAILPAVRARRPQAIMLQCGADALEEDPLAKLSLSNNAHFAVAAALRDLATPLVVTGGGGYNPWTVGRCWAGVWATLKRFEIPEHCTTEAEAVLRGLSFNRAAGRNPPAHWFNTIRDAPRSGPVRDDIKRLAAMTLAD